MPSIIFLNGSIQSWDDITAARDLCVHMTLTSLLVPICGLAMASSSSTSLPLALSASTATRPDSNQGYGGKRHIIRVKPYNHSIIEPNKVACTYQ